MTLDDLGEPSEVPDEPARGQAPRLVAALIGVGLAIGLIVGGLAWFIGGTAQTEAGLCRITWAPCTSLSLPTVELLSGVDLPEGSVVVSAYSQDTADSTEFRAQVILPDDSPVSASPLSTAYTLWYESLEEFIPAVTDSGLTDVSYWNREFGSASSTAVQGTDSDGRTVLLFDTHEQR
jgi:hypothetical protein